LSERKVSLKILNLGIDTGTPAGKLVYSIIAAVAEIERDVLIERTSSGLAARRARGRKGCRKREFLRPPFERPRSNTTKGSYR
ncbi:MAG: recombinase family protein, partial [Acidimicrobiales bacterium]